MVLMAFLELTVTQHETEIFSWFSHPVASIALRCWSVKAEAASVIEQKSKKECYLAFEGYSICFVRLMNAFFK